MNTGSAKDDPICIVTCYYVSVT